MLRTCLVAVVAAGLTAQVALTAELPDLDGDGVHDGADNCAEVANDQLDTDLDGYGNACDADFDQDGAVDAADLLDRFLPDYREGADSGAGTDTNGDGIVDGTDLASYTAQLVRGAPGPTGLACAGRVPCALAPPMPQLPIVQVRPVAGALGQDAIDAALAACGSGCNLLFLADTYHDVAMQIGRFPDGFAMYGFGMGRTTLRAPLFDATDWAPTVYITADAPDGEPGSPGVVVQGMTLDGRKNEQTPVVDASNRWDQGVHAIGILTGRLPGPYPVVLRSHGEIREVEVHDYVKSGIVVVDSPDWIVRDSYVHHIGCNQAGEACGCSLADESCVDLGWNDLEDALGSTPGLKVPGVGIVVVDRSHRVAVLRNVLHGVTKIGISVFWPQGGAGCGDLVNPPRGVFVHGNEVRESQTGFANNGGCQTIFHRNSAHDLEAPDAGMAYTGKGFTCTGNGGGSMWVENVAQRAHGPGFDIGCTEGNLTFRRNVSLDNCQGAAFADIRIKGPKDDPPEWPDGVWVDGPIGYSPRCVTGLHIENRTGVTLDGGAVAGGKLSGIQLRSVEGVVIRNVEVTSTHPEAGSDIGLRLDLTHRDPDLARLADLHVESTTKLIGFAIPVAVYDPVRR